MILRLIGMGILLLAIQSQTFANINSKILKYEKSSKVRVSIKKLFAIKTKRKLGRCAKHVRIGYQASGLIQSHPGINYAKNYTPYFNQKGWTNLFASSTGGWSQKLKGNLFSVPAGCAVVYSSLNQRNDRNGFIGHIEVRTKPKRRKSWGYISDYWEAKPRTGFKCLKKGKSVKRLRTFTARKGSPFHKRGKKIKRYIKVRRCLKYSSKASSVGDEWNNRKVIGVHCKL